MRVASAVRIVANVPAVFVMFVFVIVVVMGVMRSVSCFQVLNKHFHKRSAVF
jgi:hypothetical protein